MIANNRIADNNMLSVCLSLVDRCCLFVLCLCLGLLLALCLCRISVCALLFCRCCGLLMVIGVSAYAVSVEAVLSYLLVASVRRADRVVRLAVCELS